jgi:hypothetical protein
MLGSMGLQERRPEPKAVVVSSRGVEHGPADDPRAQDDAASMLDAPANKPRSPRSPAPQTTAERGGAGSLCSGRAPRGKRTRRMPTGLQGMRPSKKPASFPVEGSRLSPIVGPPLWGRRVLRAAQDHPTALKKFRSSGLVINTTPNS